MKNPPPNSSSDDPLQRPTITITTTPYSHKRLQQQKSLLQTKQSQNAQRELHARKISQHSKIFLFVWNIYSTIVVFITALVTIESVLGIVLTVGATLLTYYSVPDENSAVDGVMPWNGDLPTVLLSFAVVTPLSSSISMAFARRESALRSLAKYKSAVYNLYVAHVSWDWGECWKNKGRRGCLENMEDLIAVSDEMEQMQQQSELQKQSQKDATEDIEAACARDAPGNQPNNDEKDHTFTKKDSKAEARNETKNEKIPLDWLNHSDTLLTHLITLSDSLHQYLTLPTTTRARHRVTTKGISEAKTVFLTAQSLFTLNTSGRMVSISQLCEALKYRGLPGNEASRIRQWENFMTTAMEELKMVKEYRTPQALRSFGRLFTLLLPPLYAPTYVQVARDSNSLALGIVIGIVTSLALTGLFECLTHLEDPFVANVTLDGIDVREELVVLTYGELMMARSMLFPDAEKFILERSDGIGESNVCGDTIGEGDSVSNDVVRKKNRRSRHEMSAKGTTIPSGIF
mmetsp:Transcript_2108/g.4444  ORF Transcript_2108/g.4444 Transcript_2108/m.4444 type:complete len:517 (-) Transcript_2108:872-2422(-)